MAQLLVDLLTLEEGHPGKLRRRRFTEKWGIEDRELLSRLWDFSSTLMKSGLGKPVTPVYRTSRGDMLLGNEEWVILLEEGAPPLPDLPELKKLKRVQRGRATRADRAENSVAAINRSGILDRILDQKMRLWLYDEQSSAADLVTKLLKPLCKTGVADPRLFPLGKEFEGSIYSLALLEALHLIYFDRYLEKCFVCNYSAEIKHQCCISACKAPYFIPPRKGAIGCAEHCGRTFRNSAAFKALVRSGASKDSSLAPPVTAPSDDWQKPLLKDTPNLVRFESEESSETSASKLCAFHKCAYRVAAAPYTGVGILAVLSGGGFDGSTVSLARVS